jgi:hypothetical protein
MTLIELVVALAIAATLSVAVVATSSAVAVQVRSRLAAVRGAVGPADVLTAMLADIRADKGWTACLPSRGCPAYVGSDHGMAIVANHHAWAIHDRGLRTCFTDRCELALGGVSALQVVVDWREGDVLRRAEATGARVRSAHRVEIRLWLTDGSMRSRSAWLPR